MSATSAQEVVLDVSDLEPPEPLLLSLAAARALKPGEYLHLIHRRRPCLLYDNLEPEGFRTSTRRGGRGLCEVWIWRGDDPLATEAAERQAAPLGPWQD